MPPKRTAFFISDGTGITSETLGNTLLTQFGNIQFERVTCPFIDNEEKAREVVHKINTVAEHDGVKPIIFDTIVNKSVREIVAECNGFTVDIFSTFLSPLEQELEVKSSYSVGKSHSINNESNYKSRIEAVHFALENDDGSRLDHYTEADVILAGVSRSGKTPTCLYLAMQFGVYAANYPITEEDIDELGLPKALKRHKSKIFGLTIEPERLAAIRHERTPNTRYSSEKQCEFEVHEVEKLFKKENIPFLNTTKLSIEEIATRILAHTGIDRNL
jgi:[pyruvate, water dikinase]-phosphate phosphotransferase / [pyruvate, water dikinase] kinase